MHGRPSRRSSGGRRGQPPQQPQNPTSPLQNPINPTQNPGFTPPQQVSSSTVFRPQNSRDMLESIDHAVGKARYELSAAGENVSAWKVAQSALLMLKVDSWDSLGFQMQQVPSLNLLMLTEAKINAFIHCFVGVQTITSLYDMEVAICKKEKIEQFEELGLGPLLRHPLVLHYFAVKSDTTKVFKITSRETISLLSEFMDTSDNKRFSPEEILDFIVKKRSAASKEDLGIRIHSVGNYISAIRKAKKLEKKSVKGFEKKIDAISTNSAISMLPNEVSNLLEDELSVDNNLKIFITTWREACRKHTVTEVLDMMLRYNNTKALKKKEIKKINKIKSMFSLYPLSVLLNVAVSSIKCGMWDSMYDTFQTGSLTDNCPENVSIDVEQITKDEPKMKDPPVITEHIVEHMQSVSVEDIIRKITLYFESDQGWHNNSQSLQEKIFIFLRKLCDCELWLLKEFGLKEFTSLGHGEFFIFLEKYASLLPHELCKFPTGDVTAKCPLEVCLLQHHLVVLVSQALNSLWEDETITKEKTLLLLRKQFPLVSFTTTENGSVEDFLSIVGKLKNAAISNCVLFSMALFGTSYARQSSAQIENVLWNSTLIDTDSGQKAKPYESVTSKDAIEVLLRAPMMSDLNLWSHWDLLFAPSLGPLLPWLLKEVNTDELLCLVTKDGKLIRLDHSATVDSFLEAALQGSSFQTAVRMLSLFSLVGGEKHVPVSLLKIHIQHAFEVILKNYLDGLEVHDNNNSFNYGEPLSRQEIVGEVAAGKLCSKLHSDIGKMNGATSVISRFVLECLGYLPAEFRDFAADILLSGIQSVVKHAPSAILGECIKPEQRLMLHEVGLSLGIVEWITDYHEFCSKDATDLFISADSLMNSVSYGTGSSSMIVQDVSDEFSASEQSMGASGRSDEQTSGCTGCLKIDSAEASDARNGYCSTQGSAELNEHEDAAQVIESIRRDEFGLDSTLQGVESIMLKKQHARLGRALHCLSQELYSQDSHFLLELVQNADDNTYPTNVEPTLTFILQESGIIVLNNEQGFSSQNIRALCDVGSSTKKGSNAGYIGQKGIGFKSVFRVTDAPEIHSNGFHFKFDISEGQIGFVLPTVVPPCNIDLFSRLTSGGNDQSDRDCWNTCIVLPFKSKLSDATVMKNIINMFSDLHPSLLLFLHRLQCIKFRNLLDDSLTVMRKEIVGDGIVKVSLGKEKMIWFIVSQKLQAEFVRSDVQETEISIALTLKESNSGDYSPDLRQHPVFAFLPLRTYGLKFILQGDFAITSSREEVDGDSPWNQWLLSEFPGLFINAERSFCALPCYRENPGRAVAAYMSFVPLVGEVHGFFSSIPRLIISKLRMSNCLLLEGGNNEWVPPCKVLRGWNERAHSLLPDSLLHEHLGLGFLDRNIVLSDQLASALGIAEYGPKVLLQVMVSLCHKHSDLKSMGFGWLAFWLSELYAMFFSSSVEASFDSRIQMDVIEDLRKIPFIPLSDGTYGAIDEGSIWLHFDASCTELEAQHGLESFPHLYAKLRTVNPALLSTLSADMSSMDVTTVEKLTCILFRIGVQKLSTHEIVKVHILPAMSEDRIMDRDKNLMIEYLCFVMLHLQSSCSNCHVERECIISEIRDKAYISTNHGFKRPSEVSIHFSQEFGNPVDIKKLINMADMKWHEVDISYLRHPVAKSLPCELEKWRQFFQQIGITDFVKVVQVEKGTADISDGLVKNLIWDKDLISLRPNITDWESPELVDLLSLLARDGNKRGCEYLLEVLDTLWDDCYSEKTTGYYASNSEVNRRPFKSSFISSICDVQWVASAMDDVLHYPKHLYHDCDAVRSTLGASAPFAIPKVRSENFVRDIGFKTMVSLDDALEVLKLWRRENEFQASLGQMLKFYTLIWNEMAASTEKIAEVFHSGPSIFIPYASSFRHEDVVSGTLLSPAEVYWHDSTSFVDQIREIHHQCSSAGVTHGSLIKMLCNFYPGLHDFFVNVCGVHEIPPLRSYLQILLHLSNVALPSQAASAVFQVFLKWTDGLKSGLSAEDVLYLKDSLTKIECTVLPTLQDTWVSLHPSFGLVCWCDDKKLSKHFKHLDGIDFIYLGELSKDDEEMLCMKVSILMQTLGIPALSEVVTREAIYSGIEDCSLKAALLDWALPYAQRYLHGVHPDKYSQLKQSEFEMLNCLQVVVVEKLFYRNVIKATGSESKTQVECSCLLMGSILYTTQESDSHALFLELSRLFFNGSPELHLANFLHMITTMAESGSNKEQTEFFILNSQKVPKLPDGESVWSLSGSEANLAMHIQFDPSSFGLVSDAPDLGSSNFSNRDQLRFGTPNSTQAILTGRLGELVAFKFFVDKAGEAVVKWVNEHNETGLPYDIVLGEKENREYIEVKTTKSTRKDWFEISMRELQFAVEKGEAFSIAHVILLDDNVARVSVYNNLAKLCQLHKLRLAVLMPEQQKEFSLVSQS
ncbi:hypothetical protein EV1_031292 [Malus domestica]